MKRKYLLFLLILLLTLLLGSTVYAEQGENQGTDTLILTDENRYDPLYYQKPEKRYASSVLGRSVRSSSDLEDYLVDSLQQFQTAIDVSAYGISRAEAGAVYFQVLNDHPELFYVEGSVKWSYNSAGKVTSYHNIVYRDTTANIKRQQKELEQAVEQALTWVEPSMSDVEKALAVHDYLVLNCEYDEERRVNDTLPGYSHSAYGALVSRIAVCDGYSHAFSYLMEDYLGIPCELVTSNSMNHAWNLISIGGNWYHVDATWDDPIWDQTGQVKHEYFLLSDKRISDSSHKHANWSARYTAVSNTYDNAFWTTINSAFCFWQGNWHYAKYIGGERKINLIRKKELFAGQEEVIYTENETWNQYSQSFMYLDFGPRKEKIYFNTRREICSLGKDGTIKSVYQPSLSGSQLIFGFTVKENQLRYCLQSAPNYQSRQKISTYLLPEDQTPEITGVSAENVTAVYDGKAKKITVSGIKTGDKVSYQLGEGGYSSAQPQMVDAGTYHISYKVERSGCETFYGTADLVIEKAVPSYQTPGRLEAVKGQLLGEIKLPAGFVWQTGETLTLTQEGTVVCYAKYVPADKKNYREIPDIAVEILVKDSAVPAGSIQGVYVEPVQGVYDGKPKQITVNGIQPGDLVSYTLLDRESAEHMEEGTLAMYEYQPVQPVMTDAGTYSVAYKVERKNCPAFYGTSSVAISQAVPSYTVPAGLEGSSGKTIDTVKLPAGFIWQTAKATRLLKEGTYTYYVKYIPADTRNYKEVWQIPVKVSVSCPRHQYAVKVTRKATRTTKGMETYTCRICGNTYQQEIPALAPERPGQVTGLKVKTAGTDFLKFSWKKEKGVSYRLILYQGKKIISTKNTSGDTYTYKKLKAASEYTLKITPYRTVNGEKIYSSSGKSLKAATGPGKVKLISVRQKGSSKGKITWRRTAGVDGYEISMKTGNGKYKIVKRIARGKTVSYTQTKLKKGRQYRFRVRAYKKSGQGKSYGTYSNVKSFKLK